jgi:hypothetical protein
MLFLDPRVAHLPNQTFLPALTSQSGAQARAVLGRALQSHSCRLLLLRMEPGTSAILPAWPAPVLTPLPFSPEDPLPESADQESAAIEAIRRRRRQMMQEAPPVSAEPVSAPAPAPAIVRQIAVPAPQQPEGVTEPRRLTPRPARATAPPFSDMPDGAQAEAEPQPFGNNRIGHSLAARLLAIASTGLRGLARLLTRMRGTGSRHEPALTSAEKWFMIAASILIPLMVTVAVTQGYDQFTSSAGIGPLRQESADALARAENSNDPAQKREAYLDALRLIDEGEVIRPGDTALANTRRTVLEGLDRMDNVTRLQAQVRYRYPSGSDLTGIAAGNEQYPGLYLIDNATSRLLYHPTGQNFVPESAEPQILFSSGNAIGNHIVRRPLDLLWLPGNSTQDNTPFLLALDSGGAILAWNPENQSATSIPLALSSQWGRPSSLATYLRRLYVLDTPNERIWRYKPGGAGWDITQDDAAIELPGQDLHQAADIFLDGNGGLYVAYTDGRVRRYYDGRLNWDESGLDSANMIAPVSLKIGGTGLGSSLYVLDPGSRMLVEIALSGSVINKYRLSSADDGRDLLGRARDFVIAGTPARLFVITDNEIVETRLP